MGRGLRKLIPPGLVAVALVIPAVGMSTPGPTLSQLRVCGHDQVPFQGSGCPNDQSSHPVNASEFDCSVRIMAPRATSFLAQFVYQGAVQYQYTAHVRRGTHSELIGVYFHDTEMPGGHYGCRFTLGHRHLGKSFTGGGPSSNVLGPSVCLAAHRVGIDECPRDESSSPLPPTSGITCDAVFARERGQSATVELLDAGGNVIASQQDSLAFPITEAGATFTNRSGNYAAGVYDCAFTVAGHRADRQFSAQGSKPAAYRRTGS